MRILNRRVVNIAENFTATNSSVNYLPSYISHPYLRRRFQSTSNSSVLTITLSVISNIDCFFYALHNLSTLTAVFKDTGGSTIDTIVVSQISDIGREYFNEVEDVKTIELTMTTSETYLKIGGFEAGLYYQMPDLLNGYPLNTDDNSLFRKSRGGQSTSDIAAKLRSYSFNYVELTQDAYQEIESEINDISTPLYIDIFEDDNNVLSPGYFNILNIPNYEKQHRRFTTNLSLQGAF